MNEKYNRLVREGYSYTGITNRDHDKVVEKSNKYRTMGNKVSIVVKTDVSPRRGMPDEKYTYYVALVKFSEEWKAHEEAERVKANMARRQRELAIIAVGLTMDEALAIIKMKVEAE